MKFPPHFLEEVRARLPVSEVVGRRVRLKKAGREWKGLSPFNREKSPSFTVNDQKRFWHDFSSGKNGDIFGFIMETEGLSFPEAVESLARLAGIPMPKGIDVRQQSPEEAERLRQEEARRQARYEQERARREREDEMDEAQRLESARRILGESTAPITGTPAERYLIGRGLPIPAGGWPDCIFAHRSLKHSLSGKFFPALICRVDDPAGDFCGIWRIYVTDDGGKAPVDDVKLGLGSTAGGAVRIGGCAPHIGVGEGVESSLGAWFLIGQKRPVWASLSTSGMVNFEPPLDVRQVTIWPDGDWAKERPDGSIGAPSGIRAARDLQHRLSSQGVTCGIAAEPGRGCDYLDVWRAVREREEEMDLTTA